jgi:hypothetical protein
MLTFLSKVLVGLLASLAQTPKYSVPAAAPVLSQSYQDCEEYPWSKYQVGSPCHRAQNSKSGWWHVTLLPEMVISVPAGLGEVGYVDT